MRFNNSCPTIWNFVFQCLAGGIGGAGGRTTYPQFFMAKSELCVLVWAVSLPINLPRTQCSCRRPILIRWPVYLALPQLSRLFCCLHKIVSLSPVLLSLMEFALFSAPDFIVWRRFELESFVVPLVFPYFQISGVVLAPSLRFSSRGSL